MKRGWFRHFFIKKKYNGEESYNMKYEMKCGLLGYVVQVQAAACQYARGSFVLRYMFFFLVWLYHFNNYSRRRNQI